MGKWYQEHASKDGVLEQIKAIDRALGLPRKGVNIGKAPHAPVPDSYSPGAVGWTETECTLLENDARDVCLILTDAAVALGKLDVVVDGKTVKLDLTKDVLPAKPEKFNLKDVNKAEPPLNPPGQTKAEKAVK